MLLLAGCAYVLSALLPLVLMLSVPDSGRSNAWVATILVVVWAGLRLSHRMASGQPRLFDFVFWLFTYIFMGLAPTVQLRSGEISRTTPGMLPDLDAATAAAVWGGILAYEIGVLWSRHRTRARLGAQDVSTPSVVWTSVSYRKALVLAGAGIISAAYFIQAVGINAFFASRYASFAVRSGVFPDVAVRSIVEAASSLPLLVAAGAFILLRRASTTGERRRVLTLLIIVTAVPLLIVVNPFSSARYEFGVIGFAFIVLAGAMATRARTRASMIGIVAAFLFVFPIADANRTDVFGIRRSGFFAEYAGNPDYDAFWQITNSLAYVNDVGLKIGQQLMGTLLFWIPRAFWPTKPVDTGIELADFRGYSFTNLSAPLWSELLMNGSWVALAAGFVGLGVLTYRLDDRISASLLGGGQLWSLVGAIFPFLMVILLRGSLLQAMGTLVVAVGAVWFVRDRLGRPAVSQSAGGDRSVPSPTAPAGAQSRGPNGNDATLCAVSASSSLEFRSAESQRHPGRGGSVAAVTIGMPVFNGERFLNEAVTSVLGQSYRDLMLVIADNASTDGTESICRAYAERDERVTYLRHDSNVGAAENFNALARRARTPYFKWAAADDVHAPAMVARCVEALERHPTAIAAYTKTMQIDEDGAPIKVEASRLRGDAADPHVRFRRVISMPHSCFSIFGVFRTDVLQRSSLIEGFVSSDRALLAELALAGPSVEIAEPLIGRRMHANAYSHAQSRMPSSVAGYWTTAKDHSESLRTVYHRIVDASPYLSDRERGLCHREVETSYRLGRLLDVALKQTSTLRSRLPTSVRPAPAATRNKGL